MSKKPTYEELGNPHLVDGKYSIKDLIDIESLHKTLEKFSLATGFTTGLLEYPSQEILIATGWRDICTKFHRACPESATHCKDSNVYLTKRLKQLKELNIKPCENGLVDGATPIIIKGKYIAYLATGQILFDEPDIERFKKQAEMYGYDLELYLEALSEVPVVSEDQFKNALSFLSELAVTIAETGLKNLELVERARKFKEEISERKSAEKALRESEEKYKQLTEQLSDVILTVKLGGRLSYLSPAIKGFGGYNPEEEVGNHIAKYFVNKKELIKALKLIKQIYIDKKPASIEFLFKPLDRDPFYVEVTGRPLIVENKVKSAHCVMRNITDRKQAEKRLRESEEKYRTVLETSLDPIVVYDMEGYVTYFNPAFTRIFGWTLEERLGQKMDLFVPEDVWPETQKMIEKVLDGEKFSGFETRRYTKGGNIVHVNMSAAIYKDQNGNPLGSVINLRDITEQKKLEAQLLQAQKMESIGTLAGGIAHDFNNVLYSIIGYSELTMEDLAEGSLAKNNLQQVHKAAMRAKDMVQQILSFSRRADIEKKPIKAQTVVKDALKMLRTSIPTTIEIHQNINTDCRPVLADPTQLHQVVMNLATNAYQAMREKGGVLELTLTEEKIGSDNSGLDLEPGTYIKLTVNDTGHGMDNVVMDKIFDPYFTTRRPGEGTGMGLAVVHGIVKSHDGDIKVYSKLGEGTAFHIYLPLIDTRPVESKTIAAEPIPTGTERILFVDDEEDLVFMTQQILERLGYQVTPRTSSVEALEAFRAKPNEYDLVITDMTMPNMTGAELAPKLKKIKPEVPIIICTGFSEMIDEDKAKVIGIRAYIMKPVITEEIARTIRKVLDEGKEK